MFRTGATRRDTHCWVRFAVRGSRKISHRARRHAQRSTPFPFPAEAPIPYDSNESELADTVYLDHSRPDLLAILQRQTVLGGIQNFSNRLRSAGLRCLVLTRHVSRTTMGWRLGVHSTHTLCASFGPNAMSFSQVRFQSE